MLTIKCSSEVTSGCYVLAYIREMIIEENFER